MKMCRSKEIVPTVDFGIDEYHKALVLKQNTISGDGEELDCYVLGINKEIENFEGKCIAVIHRTNDNDDKLIVVPKGKNYNDEEIKELINFQEQYFESEIIR